MRKTFLAMGLLIGLAATNAQVNQVNLNFSPDNYEQQTLSLDGKTFRVRAYENITYIGKPVDTTYQKMNVYIPEEYFTGERVNGYTTATAPIFFPNKVGGYMPAQPASTKSNPMGDHPPLNGGTLPAGADKRPGGMPATEGRMPPLTGNFGPMQNTVLVALSKGYVVASAGARGRTSKDAGGTYTGKAPAGLVDLKAAIRYLKFNDKNMPGNAVKIISNGTSAGGAMSTLLGATGNNPDYEPYLKALGAAPATDDVFAVSVYCPITNLDHADAAYEWQFNGVNTYKRGFPMQQGAQGGASELTTKQVSLSRQLKTIFPAYLNGLKLKDKTGNLLTLDTNGNGNFKDWVKTYVMASAQGQLDKGNDLSGFSFLTISNGKVTALDFDGYVGYMERQKTPPAFDALDLSAAENMLFGSATLDKQHFTAFSTSRSTAGGKEADAQAIKMMNPMNYIGQAKTTRAKYWRIRHGTKDKDTGLAISVILATQLQNKRYDVDFALPWERPHSGDYDLEELFGWMDSISK